MIGNSYSPAEFRVRLEALWIELPLGEEILCTAEGSPLAQPIRIFGKTVGNRWAVHPMEGWDGTEAAILTCSSSFLWSPRRRFGRTGSAVWESEGRFFSQSPLSSQCSAVILQTRPFAKAHQISSTVWILCIV